MIRRIHCEECDRKTRPQHPEDVAMGWKRRRVQLRAKKPPVHDVKIIVNGELKHTQHLPSLVCDACNAPLPDVTPAFALTEWQENREGEPGQWEKEYTE